jgi:Sulfotransferase family
MVPGPAGDSESVESRLIWMFGSPRSGSTWLRRMAEQHPQIVGVNEPLLGNHLSPFLSDEPGYRAEDLDVDTFSFRRVLKGDPDKFFAEKYADVWVPGLRRLINDRFQAHLEREADPAAAGETLLMIKEPNGSQSADVIMRAQPTARLLFLLRDGRDVVDSEVASFMVGGWQESSFDHMRGIEDSERLDFVVRSAHHWLWRTDVIEAAFAEHPGPKHLVRYEDLLQEPERNMRVLFAWLEVETDAIDVGQVVDEFSFERLPYRGANKQNRFAKPGAWRENLRPEERDAVQDVLGPKLRELGYD